MHTSMVSAMTDKPSVTKLDFSRSPVVADFMQSKGFVRGIMGPR